MEQKEVADAIWRKDVTQALAAGCLQTKPDPIVMEGGLSKVQEGLDRQKAGVSAAKIVIDLGFDEGQKRQRDLEFSFCCFNFECFSIHLFRLLVLALIPRHVRQVVHALQCGWMLFAQHRLP